MALQRMLGHTNMQMTQKYVHLSLGDLKEQHYAASPLNSVLERKGRKRQLD